MPGYVSIMKKIVAFSALLLLASLASFALAQSQSAPNGPAQAGQQYMITVVHVQLGAVNEWRNLVKSEYLPAMKKAGVGEFRVWTVALGEEGEFWLARAIKDMTELDDPSPMAKALGQAGADAMMAKLRRLTVSARGFVITSRPDLSVPTKAGYEAKLAVLNQVRVAPGHVAEFEDTTKKQAAVLGKTNVKGSLMSRISMGANANQFNGLMLFDSFKDINQFIPALRKASPDAQAMQTPPGVVAFVERIVLRYIPELSIAPAAK